MPAVKCAGARMFWGMFFPNINNILVVSESKISGSTNQKGMHLNYAFKLKLQVQIHL